MTNVVLSLLLLLTWFPASRPVPERSTITLVQGEGGARARLALAVSRFEAAGLDLPDLVVRVGDGICGGHMGLFVASEPIWEIRICNPIEAVWEHELAHAWERHTLDDAARRSFMDAFGYEAWSGESVPWNERGVEAAAFLIQQGLSGLPITGEPSPELVERWEGYTLLTGRIPLTLDRDCVPIPPND